MRISDAMVAIVVIWDGAGQNISQQSARWPVMLQCTMNLPARSALANPPRAQRMRARSRFRQF
jgi:hypothetical protein